MLKPYKAAIVGHLAEDKIFNDGQTVKTRNLYRALCEQFGCNQLKKIDTYGFNKRILGFTIECIKGFFRSENIIILPAHNGVCVFIPFFCFLSLFGRRKLHYIVVGGWLPEFLKKHRVLRYFIKKLDLIYVETSSMKRDLDEQGINNIVILPNFKYITPLKKDELIYNTEKPFKLCIFSRIMKEKGIEDAIETIKQINAEEGEIVYNLDIYGPVDDGYIERFEQIKAELPQYISYKGVIPAEESVGIIKDYFALLFPTRFYTEGVPGTLIDAMAAGVPVISSLWVNYKDVFIEGITGWGYEFENINQFKQLLLKAAEEPDEFLKMKKSALEQAKKYEPSVAISELLQRID